MNGVWWVVVGVGVFFVFDFVVWYMGICEIKFGNVLLFGNLGSIIVMVWGFVSLCCWLCVVEVLVFVLVIGGVVILMGCSFEIDVVILWGDLFCLFVGFFYVFYILLLGGVWVWFGNWSLLFWLSVIGVLLLLLIVLVFGE